MIWYTFDITGFPESIHHSLARAFMRASQRESSPGNSHLYAAPVDHEVTPATYFLCTSEERIFLRLIRQFGGRRTAAPPKVQLKEVPREGGSKTPTPEVDTFPC
jgi:hypothetical protein